MKVISIVVEVMHKNYALNDMQIGVGRKYLLYHCGYPSNNALSIYKIEGGDYSFIVGRKLEATLFLGFVVSVLPPRGYSGK